VVKGAPRVEQHVADARSNLRREFGDGAEAHDMLTGVRVELSDGGIVLTLDEGFRDLLERG